MTRVSIKLEDKHTRQGRSHGLLVDASLCLDISAADMQAASKMWQPLTDDALQRRQEQGLPDLENPHWNWSAKVIWLSTASYRSLGVECEGAMQGLMLVVTDGCAARLPPDQGKPLVYVDYVQVAPWNNKDLVDRPRFGAIGSFLMEGAARLSIDMEYGGRVGLHSLKSSEGFYEKLGLSRVEVEQHDHHVRGLWYFEWTKRAVADFLKGRTP